MQPDPDLAVRTTINVWQESEALPQVLKIPVGKTPKQKIRQEANRKKKPA